MFFESLRISISSIYMNKLRSSLTALGIIIGVLSVTVMGTLISGLDRSFENSMSWLGKDILYISRWEWFSDMEWWEVRNRPRMKLSYEDKIREMSDYALAVSPVMQRGASLSFGEITNSCCLNLFRGQEIFIILSDQFKDLSFSLFQNPVTLYNTSALLLNTNKP